MALLARLGAPDERDGQCANGGGHDHAAQPWLPLQCRVNAARYAQNGQCDGRELPQKPLDKNEHVDPGLLFPAVGRLEPGFLNHQINEVRPEIVQRLQLWNRQDQGIAVLSGR